MNYFLISIIVIVLLVRFIFIFNLIEGFDGKCIKSVLPPFTFDITTAYSRDASGELILDINDRITISGEMISDKALQNAKKRDLIQSPNNVFELGKSSTSGLLSDPFNPNFKYFDTRNCNLV